MVRKELRDPLVPKVSAVMWARNALKVRMVPLEHQVLPGPKV